MSASENVLRLNKDNQIFTVNEELPDQYAISVMTTFRTLQKVKANKATGPDNIPPWVLRNHADIIAPRFNKLRVSFINGAYTPVVTLSTQDGILGLS